MISFNGKFSPKNQKSFRSKKVFEISKTLKKSDKNT